MAEEDGPFGRDSNGEDFAARYDRERREQFAMSGEETTDGRRAERDRKSYEYELSRLQLNFSNQIIATAIYPEEITAVTRMLTEKVERVSVKAPTFNDRFGPMQAHRDMEARAQTLSLGLPENAAKLALLKRGKKEGEIIGHEMIPPFREKPTKLHDLISLDVLESAIANEQTVVDNSNISDELKKSLKKDIERRLMRDRNAKLTENLLIEQLNALIEIRRSAHEREERAAEARRRPLVNELKRSSAEFSARNKLDFWFDTHERFGGSVDKIAEDFLQPKAQHMQAEDFENIFKAPEVGESPERHGFGDKIDRAMRLYYIVGLAEDKTRMLEIIHSPGFKKLYDNEDEHEKLLEMIGEVRHWVSNNDRFEDSYLPKNEKYDHGNGVYNRGDEDHRGVLTKRGNIFAHAESAKTKKTVDKAIQDYVGNAASAELGRRLHLLFGIAASQGSIVYSDGSIAQEGFPESSDMVKLMDTKIWQDKQISSNYPAGPPESRGELKRLAVDFMSFTTVGEKEKRRSLMEKWWGYPDEEAQTLGEMNWEELKPNVLRDWKLRLFIAGQKEQGLFDMWKKVGHRLDEIGSRTFWEGMNKKFNIVINLPLVLSGKFRGTYNEKEKKHAPNKVEDEQLRLKGKLWDGIKNTQETRKSLRSKDDLLHGRSNESAIEEYQTRAGYL